MINDKTTIGTTIHIITNTKEESSENSEIILAQGKDLGIEENLEENHLIKEKKIWVNANIGIVILKIS